MTNCVFMQIRGSQTTLQSLSHHKLLLLQVKLMKMSLPEKRYFFLPFWDE